MADKLTPNSSRAELRKAWKTLSPAMRRAMNDAAHKPLFNARNGWTSDGVRGHQQQTILAQRNRGLVEIYNNGVVLTALGLAVFRSIGEPADAS